MILLIILIHLLLFEGMFVVKNILLSKKLKAGVRGKNKEASISIILFAVTILTSVISVLFKNISNLFIPIEFLSKNYFMILGFFFLCLNLIISYLALIQMSDSWRIGIKENDTTELISDGIFKISRNPYFVSYIFLFIAYIFLAANVLIVILTVVSFWSIHRMILKEEKFLTSLHGDKYLNYKSRVPRYIIF